MEALWRWTSPSVFLLLAHNIGRILSQSVGPNCPLQLPLQGEPICDGNPGLVNPQLQTNNFFLYPPNGIAPGEPIGLVPECWKPPFQEGFCSQNLPLNQQANFVPISCANLGLVNAQVLGPSCAGPSGPACNIPGPLVPFSQPIPQQGQCPIGPSITPCQSQQNSRLPLLEMLPAPQGLLPFPQGILPCQSLVGPPVTSLIPTLVPGIDLPGPSLCQQIDSSPFANGAFLSNHFTPLVPIANPGLPLPCIDVLSHGMVLPPPVPQGLVSKCPPVNPLLPLNNHGYPGASIDVFPFAQCPSALNGPPINTFPPPNLGTIQGPMLPTSQVNCLPQGPALGPQCVTLPETQPCFSDITPSSIQPSQNCLPFSPFNVFKFRGPTLFPNVTPIQGFLPSPYDPACSQGSGCANPGENQLEPICQQIPTAPVPLLQTQYFPPCLPCQNVPIFPLTSSIFQPPVLPLNSRQCPWITDEVPINFSPSQIIPQPWPISPNGFEPALPQVANPFDYTPITPLVSPPCQIGSLPPVLSIPIHNPICEKPCQSTVADVIPVPINLEINVPAPSIPAPRITIINAVPKPSTAVSSTVDEFSYFDMPPMIIESRRSRSRSWLPLILVALFAGDGNFGGNGGCCCDSDPIPIPYPIPIPTNNPVIVNK